MTKQLLVLLTITGIIALIAGVIHLLIVIAADDVDTGLVAIVWGVTGGIDLLMWGIAVPALMLWSRNLEYVIEPDKIVKGDPDKDPTEHPPTMFTDFRWQRTLYDRALGIGSIEIQSATTRGCEGKLAGLQDWERMHEDLRRRIRSDGHRERESGQPTDMDAILDELRHIRRVLETTR